MTRPFGPDGPTLRELAEQALASTEAGYDMLASRFDATPFRTPDAVVARALSVVGEVDDALDLGCGTGAALLELVPRTRRRVIGVDFSRGMLETARTKLVAAGADVAAIRDDEPRASELAEGDRPAGSPRVDLVRRDMFALGMEDEVDLVTCFGAFGHVPVEAETRFVRIIRRALRPGGRFVFATAERPARLSRAHVLSTAFNAAMRVRNAVVTPPFIMYYLTFLLPDAARLLRWEGFDVTVREDVAFDTPFQRLRLVVATRPA